MPRAPSPPQKAKPRPKPSSKPKITESYSISSRYPWLSVSRQGIDWKHVNPALLQKLNAIGRDMHKIVVIYSGYRSNAYSAQVGGFAGDPHTHGIAVDAYMSGQEIGNVVPARLFTKYGLRSGNQANFYHGKPDPGHVDLGGSGGGASGTSGAGSPSSPGQPYTASGGSTAGSAQGASILPDFGGSPTGPGDALGPQSLDPGSVSAQGFTPKLAQQLWQTLANQPNASPDVQAYAQQSLPVSG